MRQVSRGKGHFHMRQTKETANFWGSNCSKFKVHSLPVFTFGGAGTDNVSITQHSDQVTRD
jgi:hypothetical protein